MSRSRDLTTRQLIRHWLIAVAVAAAAVSPAWADGMIVPIRPDIPVQGHWAVTYHHVDISVQWPRTGISGRTGTIMPSPTADAAARHRVAAVMPMRIAVFMVGSPEAALPGRPLPRWTWQRGVWFHKKAPSGLAARRWGSVSLRPCPA